MSFDENRLRADGGIEAPPGPRWPSTVQTLAFNKWPFTFLEYGRKNYGKRFTMRTTSTPPLVFLSDPADIKSLFATSADTLRPGEGAPTIEPIVGAGSFLLMDGDKHLQARRDVAPSFHKGVARGHGDMVTTLVEREVASWPRDTVIALHPRFRALALEVVLRTVFAHQSEERIIALRERILSALTITASSTLPLPWLRKVPHFRGIWRRFLRHQQRVDELLIEMIEEGQQTKTGGDDLLGVLLSAQHAKDEPASVRQLRDHIMSVILAGHETTASEMAWAFQLLAHNPSAADALVSEIDEGSSDRYLTATVQEVMRQRPVFLFAIPRAVTRAVELGGWTYGPPVHLLGSIYLVHHDPDIYPDPHAFKPERFLDKAPDPLTWLPWGGGRKYCPGLHLATLEIKTVLRTLLATTHILPAAREIERPAWRSVIITPQKGSQVILRNRGRASTSALVHANA